MMQRNVVDYLLEQLDAWGVQHIYGVPGDAILPLVEAVGKHPRLKFIGVKHENAAALMASAEAKLLDRLCVCTATSGPGIANLINGVADAKNDHVPVLVITGQVDSSNLSTDYNQYVDQSLLMAAVTDFSGIVTVPEACNDVLVKALRISVARSTVTHVSITKDVWLKPVSEECRAYEPYLKTPAQSPSEVILEAIRRINEAERPAILVGSVRNIGTKVVELAEKWQAGICMTMAAKGLIPGSHPLVMGGLGEGGSEASSDMLAESDLILIVGTTWWPEKYVPQSANIIQLDTLPENIGKHMPVKYGLTGDLDCLLTEMIAKLTIKEKTAWVDRLKAFKEQWMERIASEVQPSGTSISPGYLIKSLEEVLSEDAIITVDVGDHTVWFNRIFTGSHQTILVSGSWRTMGFGLPAAMSAKLTNPGRQVVALVGDGCLAQVMGEFLTAVRYQLPITVIVVNNGYLAMEKSKMQVKQMDPALTTLTNPNFAKFAESCGGRGLRVEKVEELVNTLQTALQNSGPTIVDVLTNPEIFPATGEKTKQLQELAPV